MSDFDFLKEFGKNLDKPGPYESSDREWQKLANGLEGHERQKRRKKRALALVFPITACCAILGMGFLLHQTRQETAALKAEISTLKQRELTSDTLVRYVSVVHYDTLYRTIIQRMNTYAIQGDQEDKTGGAALFNAGKMDVGKGGLYAVSASQLVDRQIFNTNADAISIPVIKSQDSLLADGIIIAPAADDSVVARELLTMPVSRNTATDLLPVFLPDSLQNPVKLSIPDAFEMKVALHAPKPARPSIVARMKPRNPVLRASGGVLYPQLAESKPDQSWMLGIGAGCSFGAHLQAMAGVDYGQVNFRFRSEEAAKYGVPPVSPPTQDDKLEFIHIRQPLLNFSIGVNYLFPDQKKLQPWLGLAWVGEQAQESTLKYEFVHQVTGEESRILTQNSSNTHFNPNGMKVSAGINWVLTPTISWGVYGHYQAQRSANVALSAQRIGIGTGVYWRWR